MNDKGKQPVEEGPSLASMGIPGLDRILDGGVPRNHSYLVQGRHGTGKTTMGLQFCMAGAREGERSLYLSTTESEAEVRQIAAAHGWSLEGVELHYHDPRDLFPEGYDQSIFRPEEVELPQTMETLLKVIEKVAPQRLVIDSLSEIRLVSPEGRWFRRQILALKEDLARRRCTTLFCDGRLTSDQPVHSMVHGIFDLEQLPQDYGPDRRTIRVAKLRGRSYASGFHDLRIRPGGIEVFPRLVPGEHSQNSLPETISTGIQRLDVLFAGGLDRGTATLMLGPSGTGKSTLAAQVAVAAAQRGEAGVLYLFDERVQTLLARARGLGMKLDDHVESGLVEICQVNPAELTPGEFSDAVRLAVLERNAKVVIIDSLVGYMNAMPGIRSLSLYLHELLAFLSAQGINTILTMTLHGPPGTPRRAPIDVSYIADSILLFHSFEFDGELRRAISVYKRRGGDHEATLREIRFGSDGVRIGEPLRHFQGITSGTPLYFGKTLPRDEDDG